MKNIIIEVPKHVTIGHWTLGRDFTPTVNRSASANYNYLIVKKKDYLNHAVSMRDIRREAYAAASRIEGAVGVNSLPRE